MMDEETLDDLIKLLPHRQSISIPQLITNYQALVENPQLYFENLTIPTFANVSIVSPQDFIHDVQSVIDVKNWLSKSKFDEFLKPHPNAYQAILSNNTGNLNLHFQIWENRIMDKLRGSLLQKMSQKDQDEVNSYLAENIPELPKLIQGLVLFFFKVQIITLIQDELQFFTELLQLHQIYLLSFFMTRITSQKSKLQLNKYMTKYTFSKSPENFDYFEMYAILRYYEIFSEFNQSDVILQIIYIVESFSISLNKKSKTIINLIKCLGKLDPETLIHQTWEYPRLRLRKFFLPEFITIATQEEIRNYWENHSSKSSRKSLLKNLIGKTTDPYFFDILLEKFPSQSQEILTSVNTLPIQDEGELTDFLLTLPDKYSIEELENMFNGQYYYYSRPPLYLLHNILQRINDTSKTNKIKAKFRIAGIFLN